MKIDSENKVVRSLCLFSKNADNKVLDKLRQLKKKLEQNKFQIQTERICFEDESIKSLDEFANDEIFLSAGTLNSKSAWNQLQDFMDSGNVSANLDLSSGVEKADVKLLFRMMKEAPDKTFNFAYTFQNPPSSPFFPSAEYNGSGFSIGCQLTNLSEGCDNIEAWFRKIEKIWEEIITLFSNDLGFLGFDSSIAPLYTGKSSLVNLVKKIEENFSQAVTTDFFTKISEFIKKRNPQPVGLCGLMFPCLEDFELAREYEKGNFSIERNIFLSLHSGLGIDTYPIGINESEDRVLDILRLLHNLSKKYNKPLSVRLVSDGQARIGEKTDFQNKYLKDVEVRPL